MLVLVGAWKASTWVAAFTATGLVLGATYMLWLYRRVMFGVVVHDNVQAMRRMEGREFFVFLPITVLVLWFGVYPASLLDLMAGSIQFVLETMGQTDVALVAQN
jgi:NADH-quinone oxidoreductase subunit M